MIYDATLIAGVIASLLLIAGGMRLFGVLGGVAGFVVGAAMTGILAGKAGVQYDGAGCQRYSIHAQDC